ncbi:MAG: hypothetical protein ABI925_12480 [Verrucomicrobiota bacterium]
MSILSRARKSRGAAIMLALWALFLLSAMVISWALDIDSRLSLTGSANRVLDAEALACSGAEVALHPIIKPGSPNLVRHVSDRKSYEARITGEGGRLNINWIVAGEEPTRLEILRRYLENKGIDLNEREHMMDCLLDWVDGDDLVRLNGAEASDDYQPTNTLLSRIDELKKIKGWEEFTSNPGWDQDFTVNTQQRPKIDLAWASRDVLLAIPGLTNALVDRFLELRRGKDGIDGTADDMHFKTIGEMLALLGLTTPAQSQELSGLVDLNVPVFRVVSVGRSSEMRRTVQFVFVRTGSVPQLINWKEF